MKLIKKFSKFFLIAIGILFLVKSFYDSPDTLISVNYIYLVGAICIAVLANAISALKLSKTFYYTVGLRISYLKWLTAYIEGYLLNNTVPLAGFLYRGNYLKKKYKLSYTDYVACNYIFAMAGITTLLFMTIVVLTILDHHMILPALLVAFMVAVIIKLYIINWLATWKFVSHKLTFYSNKLAIFSELIINIYKKKYILKYLIILMLGSCIDFAVYFVTIQSLPNELPITLTLYIYLAYSLSWIIRITPANIGTQELIISAVSAAAGIGALNGVLISFLLRVVNLGGAIILLTFLTSWRYIFFKKN